MKPLMKIGYLITQHDSMEVSFTDCKGCHICDEITRIRRSIDPDNKKTGRKRTAKPKPKKKPECNISKDELYEYIMQGMDSRDISEKFNVPIWTITGKITAWFPNYNELKAEIARKNLETFDKDVFTYEVYQQMKKLKIYDKDIAAHFGITRSAIEYRVRKWKNGEAVAEEIKNKEPQLSPKERIDSLIQENANLEVALHEKEITIQLLQDKISELEHNHKHSERRSAI